MAIELRQLRVQYNELKARNDAMAVGKGTPIEIQLIAIRAQKEKLEKQLDDQKKALRLYPDLKQHLICLVNYKSELEKTTDETLQLKHEADMLRAKVKSAQHATTVADVMQVQVSACFCTNTDAQKDLQQWMLLMDKTVKVMSLTTFQPHRYARNFEARSDAI